MHLRTGVGVVELRVWHGQAGTGGRWGCPIREWWGLTAHQQLSPALEDKLAFTVTATGSYAEAAAVAAKWGSAVEASTLHRLVQHLGAEAEAQTQQRLQELPEPIDPQRGASELAVFMLDGWLVRQRGPGWGKKKTKQSRVEWHELKTGVFYFSEQAARTAGGRGMLSDKVVVSWQGEPVELGRRLHWEALRRGSGKAKASVVVADGSAWIWNVAADRWGKATQILDFYHGSEHLWNLGRALFGQEQAAPWVEPRCHRLRHGKESQVLQEIAAIKRPRGEAGKIVSQEKNYFASQAERMHYRSFARRGLPIGSGAVESACRQKQCRFKRSGQFWTEQGLRHLLALDQARQNKHWEQLSFVA
jgi:hypothetical protein